MKKNYSIKKLYVIILMLLITIIVAFVRRQFDRENNLNNIYSSDYIEQNKLGKEIVVHQGNVQIKMDVEQFIPWVLMAQASINAPEEFLKAQIVVIRTFIVNKMEGVDYISAEELALPFKNIAVMREQWFYEFKKNQVLTFNGILANITELGKKSIFDENIEYLTKLVKKTGMAVMKYKNNVKDETNDTVIKHRGEVIEPFFHYMSNGKTRSGKEILGREYGYLKSVNCDTDKEQNKNRRIKYISIQELEKRLYSGGIIEYQNGKEMKASNHVSDFFKKIDYSDKDKTGYVKVVKIGDTTVIADDFAKALGLESTDFQIDQHNEETRISVRGIGHGFGMSLCDAKIMAEKGSSWKSILKKYYDVEISEY